MRIARIAALLIGASVLGAAAHPVRAQGAQLAIAPFNVHEARGDSRSFDGAGTAIAELLGADLRQATGARVVERAAMRRTSALQPHSPEGMLGRQGGVEAAKLLGAQHVIVGGFAADASGNVRIDARAVNVATGAVEATERLQGRGDDILSLLQQLTTRLAAGMSLTGSGGAGNAGTLPLRAFVDYGRALDASDRGDQAQAKLLLEALVRDHPDFTPARTALAGVGGR